MCYIEEISKNKILSVLNKNRKTLNIKLILDCILNFGNKPRGLNTNRSKNKYSKFKTIL